MKDASRLNVSATRIIMVVVTVFLSGCTSSSASRDSTPSLAPASEHVSVAKCASAQFNSHETGPIPIGSILTNERDFSLSHRLSILLTNQSDKIKFVSLMTSRRTIPTAVIVDPEYGASYPLRNVAVTRVGQIPP